MKTPTQIAVIACAILFALARPSAVSQEIKPETATAAKRLLTVMKVKEQMAPAMGGITQMQNAMIDQQQLSAEQKKVAREIMDASFAEVRKAMAWDTAIEPMFIRIYSSHFSAAELNKLSDFFEGPDGKVFVDKQPAVQGAAMAEVQKLMMGLMPTIQQNVETAIKKAVNGP